jgi:hypothetical protein
VDSIVKPSAAAAAFEAAMLPWISSGPVSGLTPRSLQQTVNYVLWCSIISLFFSPLMLYINLQNNLALWLFFLSCLRSS